MDSRDLLTRNDVPFYGYTFTLSFAPYLQTISRSDDLASVVEPLRNLKKKTPLLVALRKAVSRCEWTNKAPRLV